MASLSLKNICKTYPNGFVAVKNFNLDIADKEFIIFVGPSGCGKSTTLRMIAGLEEITEGELWIGNNLVNDVEPKDRDIAMVFQNYALYPHMSVYDNMAFGLRQRVAMGRAIVRNPKVFLMDEPLSNLDAKLRVQMRIEISKIHQRLEATIIYVTHDQTEALTLGTRIVVMKDGVMQQVATPIDLYTKPCNLFVAGFIGSPQMNFIDAVAIQEGEDVKLAFGSYAIKLPEQKAARLVEGGYIGKEVVLGIRPEDIKDEEIFVNGGSDNVLDATVKVYEMLGAEVFLYFTVEGFDITVRVNPRTTARPGDTIKIALDPAKIHVFDKETERTITN